MEPDKKRTAPYRAWLGVAMWCGFILFPGILCSMSKPTTIKHSSETSERGVDAGSPTSASGQNGVPLLSGNTPDTTPLSTPPDVGQDGSFKDDPPAVKEKSTRLQQWFSKRKIGPLGGTLTHPSGITISIPPGALRGDVMMEVSIRSPSVLPALPTRWQGKKSTLRLVIKPHGLQLLKHAQFSMPCPWKGRSFIFYLPDESARYWRAVRTSACHHKRLHFYTDHFSVYTGVQDNFSAPPLMPISRKHAGILMPEYARENRAVLLTEDLLNGFQMKPLIQALLAAKIRVYLTTNDITYARKTYLPMFRATDKNLRFIRNDSTIWSRDWGPLQLTSKTFVNFRYYGSGGIPGTQLSDIFGYPAYDLPVYFEGGNLTSNARGECIVSTWLLEENTGRYRESILRRLFRDYLGCRKLLILPRMPSEPTGHVDLYVKFVNDDTVVVSDFNSHAIQEFEAFIKKLKDFNLQGSLRTRLAVIKKQKIFFDELAAALSSGRYQNFVRYWATPVGSVSQRWDKAPPEEISLWWPKNYVDVFSNPSGMRYKVLRLENPLFAGARNPSLSALGNYHRSYVNALLLRKRAFVPRYTKALDSTSLQAPANYWDDKFRREYEANVITRLSKAGYSSVFVEADKLIVMHGALHCVTMQLFDDTCARHKPHWNPAQGMCDQRPARSYSEPLTP